MNKSFLIGLFILAILAGYVGYRFLFQPQIKLPKGESKEEKVVTKEGVE